MAHVQSKIQAMKLDPPHPEVTLTLDTAVSICKTYCCIAACLLLLLGILRIQVNSSGKAEQLWKVDPMQDGESKVIIAC